METFELKRSRYPSDSKSNIDSKVCASMPICLDLLGLVMDLLRVIGLSYGSA